MSDPSRRTSRLMGFEGLLAATMINLGTANNNMFATRMGANADQLGRLASLPQLTALLVLIPGSLLLGRVKSSRKPVSMTAFLAGFLYSLAAITPLIPETRRLTYFIVIIALANAPVQLYNTTWQNYFPDVVAIRERNQVYTSRTSLTFTAGIVIVQLTGLLLGRAGDRPLRTYLYQMFFILAFVAVLLQLRLLRKLPEVISPSSGQKVKDLWFSLKLILADGRTRVFIVISVVLHAGWYMGWQLFFIMQVDYMGANETWLSLISVTATLVQWIMVKPWGAFIRKHGIRLAIVVGAAGLAFNPLMTITASYLPQAIVLPGMLVLNLLSAFTFPAFQLSFFQCLLEVLPERQRNLNISLFNSLLLATSCVMQLMGTTLYGALGAGHTAISLSLLVTAGIRALGALLFYLYWHRLRTEPDAGITA